MTKSKKKEVAETKEKTEEKVEENVEVEEKEVEDDAKNILDQLQGRNHQALSGITAYIVSVFLQRML